MASVAHLLTKLFDALDVVTDQAYVDTLVQEGVWM